MAQILQTDPNTGFVTVQLDDGRTTMAPAGVVYGAFPNLRGVPQDQGMGAVPAGATPQVQPAPETFNPFEQAPVETVNPYQAAPVEQAPFGADPTTMPVESGPVGGAVEMAPSPAAPPSMVSTKRGGNISVNTARLPKRLEINPNNTQTAYDLTEQELAQSYQAQREAAAAQTAAQLEVQPWQQAAANIATRQMEAEGARREAAMAEVQARLVAEEERIQATIDAIPQQDAGRWWNSKDGYQQFIGIASAAAAGFLNAGRGPNQVVETAMQLIDKDMREQETNIATAKEKVMAAERGYGRLANRLEADEMAKRENAIYKLETLKSGLGAKLMEFESDFTRAEYMKVIAAIDQEQAKARADLLKLRHDAYMQEMEYNLRSRLGFGDLAVRQGQLKLGWYNADTERAQAMRPSKADAPDPQMPVNPITGFSRQGKAFNVPGLDTGHKKELHEEIRTRAQGASGALNALRDLSNLDYGKLDSMKPEERMKHLSAMSNYLQNAMMLSGQSMARNSDKDMALLKDAAGGDMTIIKNMFDSDGRVRKEMIRNMYDDVIATQNMFIRSFYDDQEGLNYSYDAPAEFRELRVSVAAPEETLNKGLNTRVELSGGFVLKDAALSTLRAGEVTLEHAKKGRHDADPGALASMGEKLADTARAMERSKDPKLNEEATKARKVAGELMQIAVERAKVSRDKAKVTGGPAIKGGGGRMIPSRQVEPYKSPEMLSDEELRRRGLDRSYNPYSGAPRNSSPTGDGYTPASEYGKAK